MKKIILALSMLTALVPGAFAVGPLINGNQINPQTAISIATLTVTGAGVAKVTGAGGLSVTNSVDASSVTTHGAGFVGAGTGLTGTAASLTAGNVTTNANLTGGVTSVGNAATVVTNANLTGDITSVGNATTAAATQANISTLSKASGVTITNGVTSASGTFTNGITASSGTFTATGGSQYSVKASSGISALLFVGDASQLTNVPAGTPVYSTQAVSGNTTQASFLTCFTSTITLTTTGKPIWLAVSGSWQESVANQQMVAGFEVDGVPTNIITQNNLTAVANNAEPLQVMGIVPGVAAGVHSFCVTGYANGGTLTIVTSPKSPTFTVFEVH